MSFDITLIFFISLVLMWIKPGPAQLLKIATALDKGFLPAFFISLGSIIMCSAFFVVAGLGYKILSDIFQLTGFFLQVFGAIYLIYLSIKGFRNSARVKKTRIDPELSQQTRQKNNLLGFLGIGILITLSNPFWIFYFIGILPALVPLDIMTFQSFYIGATLVFISGVIVDGPMLYLITLMKQSFSGDVVTKFVTLFINISFLIIAAFLLYSAFFKQDFNFNI